MEGLFFLSLWVDLHNQVGKSMEREKNAFDFCLACDRIKSMYYIHGRFLYVLMGSERDSGR